jgi:hypothetical protein
MECGSVALHFLAVLELGLMCGSELKRRRIFPSNPESPKIVPVCRLYVQVQA